MLPRLWFRFRLAGSEWLSQAEGQPAFGRKANFLFPGTVCGASSGASAYRASDQRTFRPRCQSADQSSGSGAAADHH